MKAKKTVDNVNTDENVYYVAAKKVRFYRFAVLALLVAFVLGGMIVYKDEITLENFRYLLKYIDMEGAFDYDGGQTISLDTQGKRRVDIFKGDIVVASNSEVKIFDYWGNKVLSDSVVMSNPMLVVGDKYMLVYDVGGKKLRIYNSFSLLYDITTEYPIYAADINDNGYFCYVTNDKGYHSSVNVYNSNFEQIYKWSSSDKFVIDVSYKKDSNTLLSLATFKAVGGHYLSEIIVLSTEEKVPVKTFTVEDKMPLDITFSETEKIFLLADDSYYTFDFENEETYIYNFNSDCLKMYTSSEKYGALIINDSIVGVECSVQIINDKCEQLLSKSFDVQILDLEVKDDKMYVLTLGKAYIVDIDSGDVFEIETDIEDRNISCISDKHIVFISDSMARICET